MSSRTLNREIRRFGGANWREIAERFDAVFDDEFYLDSFADVRESGVDPKTHFMTTGWLEGRDPSPLFSVEWYFQENPDVTREGVNPLIHYLSAGFAERRDPHPAFRTIDFSGDPDVPALVQYLDNPPERRPSVCPLFDRDWYRRQLSGRPAPADPFIHYLTKGWRQKLSPSPFFDPDWYATILDDGRRWNQSPLVHYLWMGWKEGLDPIPHFNSGFYLSQHGDGVLPRANPFLHYLRTGWREGRSPSSSFDVPFYLSKYADVRAAGLEPLGHYLKFGHKEDRQPSHSFDQVAYRAELDEPLGESRDPLGNYLRGVRLAKASEVAPAYQHAMGQKSLDPDMPTILLVAHSAPRNNRLYGGERSFVDIAKAMATYRCNLIICLPAPVPAYQEALEPYCAKIVFARSPWWKAERPIDAPVVSVFEQIITDLSVDLVYVNTIMLREPLEAARNNGVVGLVHARELIDQDDHLQNYIGASAEQILAEVRARTDYLVANSMATSRLYDRGPRGFVVTNAVEAERFVSCRSEPQSPLRVGLVSSNIKKKGVEDFCEIAKLAEGRGDLQFHLIGPETEIEGEMRRCQAEGDLPSSIHFEGYASSPVDAIGKLDVVLSLSHFAESFGRTVAEAMAAEKLVVAYDQGAVSELIIHGETGFLVAPGDVSGVLDYLLSYKDRPEHATEMRHHAREHVEGSFSPRALAKAIGSVLRSTLGEQIKPRRRPSPIAPAEPMAPRSDRDALKIAYFCWHFPVPSETFILNELRVLKQFGHDVHVFCRQIPYPDFSPDFEIDFTRVSGPDELAELLTDFGADVVHGHFVYPVITDMVWPACEKAEIPFTFIAHAQDIFRYENDARSRLEDITTSKFCRKVFTLSRFHRQFLADRGVPDEKLAINSNGVDPTYFVPTEREPGTGKSVFTIARFVEKKGIDLLIAAAERLAALTVDIYIYGYGDLEEEFRAEVRERGLTNVHFPGRLSGREEILGAFAKHDLCVCPSRRIANGDMDGIPTVLMESMAARVNVLATDVAGISDLVIDGVTGLLCEPSVQSIAVAVERYFEMTEGHKERMRDAALAHLRQHYDVRKLVRNMERAWRDETIDIVLVTWNNLPELREVVRRLLKFTSFPYKLLICDNNSEENVQSYLREVEARHDRVEVLFNPDNSMVGPGTNLAMGLGDSDYVVYVCGKEGFACDYNWDTAFFHYMESSPEVGMAGHLCYSPSYLLGKDFPTGNKFFSLYRDQEFAHENPEREFLHVQGGLFVMRRAAVEDIGGFSDYVDHNGTDVELSYVMEARGWQLGEVPNMVSLFNKTRPPLSAHIDEGTRIMHPPTLVDLDWIDDVVGGRSHLCPICGWHGRQMQGEYGRETCPSCGSEGDDRSLWRFLANSTLTHRRLPAFALGLHGRMKNVWQEQFQGQCYSGDDVSAYDSSLGPLFGDRQSSKVGLLMRPSSLPRAALVAALEQGRNMLHRGGGSLLIVEDPASAFVRMLPEHGWRHVDTTAYSSFACRFGWRSIVTFEPCRPSGK